ncbi:MAG: RNase P modulator RnpM [Bacilli bacterium]|jgi:predicted RNA-binding protein YlxR (DUF448 family)
MKKRKIPLRTCIISGERHPKKEMIRVVKNKQGEIFLDETGKANGRGFYLKRDLEIIKKAKENNQLSKCLEVDIYPSLYEEMEGLLDD